MKPRRGGRETGNATPPRELPGCVVRTVRLAVRRLLGNEGDELDDITQEALLALHRALPSYRGDSSLERFAHRIAVRVALTARRKRATRITRFTASGDVERESQPPAADTVLATQHEALRERTEAAIMRLLKSLPRVQAETFVLRVMLGCSLEEVANLTGVPLNTVRSRMRVAREVLRHRVEQDARFVELLELGVDLAQAS